MKKIISIGLSILFVLCMSSIAYAENDTAPVKRLQSEEDAAIASMFFNKQYVIYDKNGGDITNTFYAAITPMFYSGNYAGVMDYFQENARHAEAITKDTTPVLTKSGLRSSHDNVRVVRDFIRSVDDVVHGFTGRNIIDGQVELRYVVNSNEGEIISASKPNILYVRLYYQHGELENSAEASQERVSISSDKSRAVFSFHVHGMEYIQDSTDIGTTLLGLAYQYEEDFSFTEYAG